MTIQRVHDNFDRPDSATLGISTSGHTWQLHSGTVGINHGAALVTSDNTLATLDIGSGEVDLYVNTSASDGNCIYFRVRDVNNWWRVRGWREAVTTTTTNYFTEYEWAQVETRTVTEYEWAQVETQTEYEWVQRYVHKDHTPHADDQNPYYLYVSRWGTSSSTAPTGYPSTLSSSHNHPQSGYSHSHDYVQDGTPYATGASRTNSYVAGYYWTTSTTTSDPNDYRTGRTRSSTQNYVAGYYWTTSTTTSDPNDYLTGRTRTGSFNTTSTVYYKHLELEVNNSGTVSNVRSTARLSDDTQHVGIKVVAKGSDITIYRGADLVHPLWTVSSSTHATATKHGIGGVRLNHSTNYVPSFDNFTADPLITTPLAPTLTSQANGTILDLSAEPSFSWTFRDPNPNDRMTAFRFRRKVSGSVYRYWSGTGWADQPVDLPAATATSSGTNSFTLTFPTATWDNGNTTYNWSVSCLDTEGQWGPYAADFAVTGSAPPQVGVTSPIGQIGDTTRPLVTWVFSDADGDVQSHVEIKIFDSATYSASNFSPDGSAPLFTTGKIAYSDQAFAPDFDLSDSATYRVYVRVTQALGGLTSNWSFSEFTIALTPPQIPKISVVEDNEGGRILVSAEATYVGIEYDATNTWFTFEFSDDDVTWTVVRGAEKVRPTSTAPFTATVYDYEAPIAHTRFYRVKLSGTPFVNPVKHYGAGAYGDGKYGS